MAELCQVIAIHENYYCFGACKIQNLLPEKKPYTLKVSSVAGDFENCGFSVRHYL
jgi:hypothetical protein